MTIDAAPALALARAARDRGNDLVLVDGFHAVKHALRFGADMVALLTLDQARVHELARDLAPDLALVLGTLLTEVPAGRLGPAVGRIHPTGVVGVARRPTPWTHESYRRDPLIRAQRTGPCVLVDGPRHEGNVGALIRVAAAAAASGVLVLDQGGPHPCVDPWGRGAVRGAAGLHWAVPVQIVRHLDAVEGPLWGLRPDAAAGGSRPSTDAVLCLGSERTGLSSAVANRVEGHIGLPMRHGVSSLNLAVAAGIALYAYGVEARADRATRER